MVGATVVWAVGVPPCPLNASSAASTAATPNSTMIAAINTTCAVFFFAGGLAAVRAGAGRYGV